MRSGEKKQSRKLSARCDFAQVLLLDGESRHMTMIKAREARIKAPAPSLERGSEGGTAPASIFNIFIKDTLNCSASCSTQTTHNQRSSFKSLLACYSCRFDRCKDLSLCPWDRTSILRCVPLLLPNRKCHVNVHVEVNADLGVGIGVDVDVR